MMLRAGMAVRLRAPVNSTLGHTMLLRAATPQDLPELDRVALSAKAHWGYTPEQLAIWATDLATQADTVLAWPTHVAEVEGRVAGFSQINPTVQPWELISLWVRPEFMRRGVATGLMHKVVAAAREAGQYSIHIDSDPNALGFYTRFGAIVVGANGRRMIEESRYGAALGRELEDGLAERRLRRGRSRRRRHQRAARAPRAGGRPLRGGQLLLRSPRRALSGLLRGRPPPPRASSKPSPSRAPPPTSKSVTALPTLPPAPISSPST